MSTPPSASQDDKLRYRLDLQAHQIDAVLDRHHVEGRVTSGSVQKRVVEFDIQAPLNAGLERVRGFRDSMMAALGVRDVAVTRQDGRWRLQVERTYEPPVPLAGLLADVADLPSGTAAIGLADTGRPLLLSFGPNGVPHVLVAGEPGAGKTTLLRTMAISLALTNRQSEVQLLLIDGGRPDSLEPDSNPLWRPLAYLPHLMTDPVSGVSLSAEVLHFLVGEMSYRRKQRVRLPRIVVLIDHAVTLLEVGGQQVVDDILSLLQNGSQAGIHLVLATSQPESSLLDVLFMSNLRVRIMGRLSDPRQGKKISGVEDSQAEYLRGAGEFIAVANGELSYFQAADMGDYDFHWELNRLLSGPRPCLLAQPYDTRSSMPVAQPPAASPRAFQREGSVQWVDPPAGPPPRRSSQTTGTEVGDDSTGERS